MNSKQGFDLDEPRNLSAAQREALLRALHSVEGAAGRWAEASRLDDNALARRIGCEFGIQGGFGDGVLWYDYWGGRNPRIEIRVRGEAPIVLAGAFLLASARNVLGLARPGELF